MAKRAPSSQGYLPTLDGWRAIAILLVLICHGLPGLLASIANPPHWLARLGEHGSIGVDLFFGISGFLICSRLIEERKKRGCINLRGFYIRRFFRILPPYFLILSVVGALGLVQAIPLRPVEWLTSLLFVRNYLPDGGPGAGWYTGHFWSLSVEEHFYLLWPAVLFFLPTRKALWAGIAGIAAITVWRTLAFKLLGGGLAGHASFYERTDVRLDGLLFGCVAALLVDRYREQIRAWAGASTTFVLAAALIACVAMEPHFEMTIQGLLISALLVSTVLSPTSWTAQALEWPVLTAVGRLSYSIYLWQQLFLAPVSQVRWPALQSLPLNLLAIAICSTLSYYLLERPMIRVGHRLAKPVTPGRPESETSNSSANPSPAVVPGHA